MSRYLVRLVVSLAAVAVIFVISLNFADASTDRAWTNFVAYTGFRSEYFPQDFLRSSPTWSSHVRLYFQFQNVGDAEITGIEFKVRYIDGFGDIVFEDQIKYHVRLAPGEVSSDRHYWYFDEPILPSERAAFSKLRGPAMGNTLRAEVAVMRIAFADETIWASPQELWSRPTAPIPTQEPMASVTVAESPAVTSPPSPEPRLEIQLLEPNGRLQVVDDTWNPLPYRVTARVTNVGDSDADYVVVRWEAPVGLALDKGDVSKKSLGRLAPGEEVTVSWNVRPQETVVGQPFYSVKASISGQRDEYRVTGFIEVPPLPSAVYIDTSEANDVKTGDFFTVRVAVRNIRTFYGAEIVVEYDPHHLELVGGALGVDRGPLFIDVQGEGEGEGERLYLPWNAPVHQVDPDGARATVRFGGERRGATQLFLVSDRLATLRFRALSPGEHEIRFVPDETRIFDRYGQTVNVERLMNAVITVHDRRLKRSR